MFQARLRFFGALMALAVCAQGAWAASPTGAPPTTNYIRWGLVWEVVIGGQFVVMLVLGFISLAVGWMNNWEIRAEEKTARAEAEAAERAAAALALAPSPAPELHPSAPQNDDELRIVIVAAITAMLEGRNFVVRQIQMAQIESAPSWAHAGRIRIHSSHNLKN